MAARAEERISAPGDEHDFASGERYSITGKLSFANEGIASQRARADKLEDSLPVSRQEADKEESDLKLPELSGQLRELTDHLESAQ